MPARARFRGSFVALSAGDRAAWSLPPLCKFSSAIPRRGIYGKQHLLQEQRS